MRVMDNEKEKKSAFVRCLLEDLSQACGAPRLAATASASSEVAGGEASKATDGNSASAWKAAAAEDQWIELDFGKPTTVNEFRIKEAPSSSVVRYVIQCWDNEEAKWVGCFKGRTIGPDFIAPVVSRATQKARLIIKRTTAGNPSIGSFEAYYDATGEVFSVARGGVPPTRVGK